MTRLYFNSAAELAAPDLLRQWQTEFDSIATPQPPPPSDDFALWHDGNQLALFGPNDKHGTWLPAAQVSNAGFSAKKMQAKRGDSPGHLLHRACALGGGMTLLDAMAGWGSDGLLLASADIQLIQVERSSLAFALLQDLYRRLGRDPFGENLIRADAQQVLGALAAQPPAQRVDVVYLDPMFGQRNKGALPGKHMQMLRELTTGVAPAETPEPSVAEWIEQAQQCARSRVVLKRRQKDPQVAQPEWQIRGRSVRYDVYPGLAA